MANFLGLNIKVLRKKNSISQSQLALQVGKGQKTIGNWETGFSQPNIEELQKIGNIFGVTLDDLISYNLEAVHLNEKLDVTNSGENVHLNVHPSVHLIPKKEVLPGKAEALQIARFEAPKVVTVDSAGRDNVVFVPVKARAGYLTGYSDPDFIGSLQSYSLPGLYSGTFRIFETKGVSMFPTLQDRDSVVCKYATTADFKDDRIYIIITKDDGILVKRCLFKDDQIIGKSDNMARGDYPNLIIDMEDVLEVWYVVMRWTRYLPAVGDFYKRFAALETKVIMLEQHLKPS